jgi:hypothetical protein
VTAQKTVALLILFLRLLASHSRVLLLILSIGIHQRPCDLEVNVVEQKAFDKHEIGKQGHHSWIDCSNRNDARCMC